MKHGIIAFLLLALVNAAMAADGVTASKEKLVGEWVGAIEIDEALLLAYLKKELPMETEEELKKQIADEKASLVKLPYAIKFKGDGTASRLDLDAPDAKWESAKWEASDFNGPKMRLKITSDVKEGKLYPITIVTFESDDKAILSTAPGSEAMLPIGLNVVLNRKK